MTDVPGDAFDAARGTDTHGTVRLDDLAISSPNVVHGQSYQTTSPEVLADTVEFLEVDPAAFTFVDVGCGKGRMLLLACEIGFDTVVGVDFAPELVEVANANLRHVGAGNAIAHVGDAAEFDFPQGDLVVFLYNPFLAEVMTPVIKNLGHQYTGRLYVAYRYPKCRPILDAAEYLEYVGTPHGWDGERGVHVWRARPRTGV